MQGFRYENACHEKILLRQGFENIQTKIWCFSIDISVAALIYYINLVISLYYCDEIEGFIPE